MTPTVATRLLPVLLMGSLLAGCASPLAPEPGTTRDAGQAAATAGAGTETIGAKGGFHPLRLGNRWEYDQRARVEIVPFVGTPSVTSWSSTAYHELTCLERVGTREYFVEQRLLSDAGLRIPTWIRYRQDARGLYEADISMSAAPLCSDVPITGTPARTSVATSVERLVASTGEPARAAFRSAATRLDFKLRQIETFSRSLSPADPGTRLPAGPGELTRLRYPLVVGLRWIIGGDPRFEATVEAAELLVLPAGPFVGWRIRIRSELFGPFDRVHVWYGRAGFLRRDAHLETDATDIEGNPFGTLKADQHEVLTRLDLDDGTGRGVRAGDLIP